MAIKRRGGNPDITSDSMPKDENSPNQNVKGVKPVIPVGEDDDGDEDSDDGGETEVHGGILNTLHSGVSTMRDKVSGAIRGGATSWFGVKKIGKSVDSGLDKLSSFANIPKTIVTIGLAIAVLGGGSTAAMVHTNNAVANLMVKQEDVDEDDCVEEINDMKATVNADTSGTEDEYARKAWAIGKAFGMTDEQCAGMLGNMSCESGMDPTSIETIQGEAYDINGPQKKAAVSDLCAFFTTTVRSAYMNSGHGIEGHTTKLGCTIPGSVGNKTIKSHAYEGADGHFCPGIGLFQYTGPAGTSLMSYAASGNRDWWDFDVQMAFAFDTTGGFSRAERIEEWIATGELSSTPAEATRWWNQYFEGNKPNYNIDTRVAAANDWFTELSGYTDDTYAQSIISLANSIAGGSTAIAVTTAEDECADAAKSYDNSDIARAAVAYAYKTTAEGRGNNGTALYRAVKDAILPGDPYYQSCDRGVATAVLWAGADDTFPRGPTGEQDRYFHAEGAAKWDAVGSFGSDVQFEDLLPGDILITTPGRRGTSHGHIVMYVGNEIVQEKYPGSEASFVSASFNSRSPGCETWSPGKFVGEGYLVFRNSVTEPNPQYTDVVAGLNLDDGR